MFDFLTDSRSDDTIAITALTEAALPGWLDGQPAPVRKWADLQGFKARKAQIVSLPGEDGGVGRVLLGLGKNGEALSPWTFVALPATLPSGNYAFDGVPDLAVAAHVSRRTIYRECERAAIASPRPTASTPSWIK